MNPKGTSSRIEWLLPKSIVWAALAIALIIPAFTLSWFMIKFNLPFLNAGDKGVIVTLALFWWLCTTILIFGWRLRR